MKFKELCQQLESKIKSSYEQSVTLEEAEKLAGEFLYAQMKVSDELKKADLDARMRKTGLKAVKAAIYMEEATKGDKKPTEAMLSALVDRNELVVGEQQAFDESEVLHNDLERYYNIFRESHIYYRGISRGKFE